MLFFLASITTGSEKIFVPTQGVKFGSTVRSTEFVKQCSTFTESVGPDSARLGTVRVGLELHFNQDANLSHHFNVQLVWIQRSTRDTACYMWYYLTCVMTLVLFLTGQHGYFTCSLEYQVLILDTIVDIPWELYKTVEMVFKNEAWSVVKICDDLVNKYMWFVSIKY